MTEEQHARWLAYFRDLADRMHLRDWHVILHEHPDERDSIGASMKCTDGRKRVTVKLGLDWETDPPEDQRHFAVHELVHVHLWDVQQMVDEDMKGLLSNQAHEALMWPYRRALEYAADALAEVIAPTMPLPPASTDVHKGKPG